MSFRKLLARSRPVKLLGHALMKCWALSGIYLFICFLLYWFYGGFLALMLLCFTVTGIIYRTEDKFLYNPESPTHARVYVPAPSKFSLPYQNVYIKSIDGTMLHAFFISQAESKGKKAPTLLYLHGNAGNIGHRLHNVVGLYYKIQCNILMLEYRGYGFSQGSPSEEGLYMDAQAGIDYLMSRSDVNTDEIIVFGRSLGGAVAIDLATKLDVAQKIWCLIVENTFTDIPEMAAVLIKSKLLSYLPLICYKNKYLSLSKVRFITVPTLFISGLADTLVPPRMMTDLFNNCKSSHKHLVGIPGGTHNETWRQPGYYDSIHKFLTQLRENPPPRPTSVTTWQIDQI